MDHSCWTVFNSTNRILHKFFQFGTHEIYNIINCILVKVNFLKICLAPNLCLALAHQSELIEWRAVRVSVDRQCWDGRGTRVEIRTLVGAAPTFYSAGFSHVVTSQIRDVTIFFSSSVAMVISHFPGTSFDHRCRPRPQL